MLNNKNAYLIIANSNPTQLQKLITMLDDSRNDIYLMIDKKTNNFPHNFHTNYSLLNYVTPINIYWGNYSQIRAELCLFRASAFEHYSYYHLLSGKDLPLTNQDNIHNFFDKHQNFEFLQYQKNSKKNINNRLNPHLFRNAYDNGIHSEHDNDIYIKRFAFSIYRHIERLINSRIPETKVPRNKISVASQWVSIDDKLVHIILNSVGWIRNTFYKGEAVDEVFIPTLINYYPHILSKVYNTKSYLNIPDDNKITNFRYIKKEASAAHPNIWTLTDFHELVDAKNNGYFFSRKFDEKIDNNIINKIFYNVMNS